MSTTEDDVTSIDTAVGTGAALDPATPPFPSFTGFSPALPLESVARGLIEEYPGRFGALAGAEVRWAFRFGKRPEDLAERIPDMGRAVILPPLVVAMTGVDLIVWIDRWAWDELAPPDRVAFVAHLLSTVDDTEDGRFVRARPDVSGFAWVAGQFGAWELGLRLVWRQLSLFSAAETGEEQA